MKLVALIVTDPDTSPANLTYTGTSTNKALVSGITFYFNGKDEVAVISLVPDKRGTDFVTITVSDGFSSDSKSFALKVTIGDPFSVLTANGKGDQLIVTLSGNPNGSYDLQTSTDLKAWISTQTVTPNATGIVVITNTISPTVKLEFLRAISR